MSLMFLQCTDPLSSRTFPPCAPTSPDFVSLVTHKKGTPSVPLAAPPRQCGAITQPDPPEGSAQAFRSHASTSIGSSVNFCGDFHCGAGSPDHGFLCPPL